MLTHKIKKALKQNWGEKAETLNCYAEVKLVDPLSSWCCYIFAMHPDEELIHCLINTNCIGIEIYIESMQNIQAMYNEEGEHPTLDNEFRRIRVSELLNRLNHDA